MSAPAIASVRNACTCIAVLPERRQIGWCCTRTTSCTTTSAAASSSVGGCRSRIHTHAWQPCRGWSCTRRPAHHVCSLPFHRALTATVYAAPGASQGWGGVRCTVHASPRRGPAAVRRELTACLEEIGPGSIIRARRCHLRMSSFQELNNIRGELEQVGAVLLHRGRPARRGLEIEVQILNIFGWRGPGVRPTILNNIMPSNSRRAGSGVPEGCRAEAEDRAAQVHGLEGRAPGPHSAALIAQLMTFTQVMKPENEGKEILLPLNDGVFVSGHLEGTRTVLVDLGTGYYMEKARHRLAPRPSRPQTIGEAAAFFDRKIEYLTQNIGRLQPLIMNKYKDLQGACAPPPRPSHPQASTRPSRPAPAFSSSSRSRRPSVCVRVSPYDMGCRRLLCAVCGVHGRQPVAKAQQRRQRRHTVIARAQPRHVPRAAAARINARVGTRQARLAKSSPCPRPSAAIHAGTSPTFSLHRSARAAAVAPAPVDEEARDVVRHAVDERGEGLHVERRAHDDQQVARCKVLGHQLRKAVRQALWRSCVAQMHGACLAKEHNVRLDQPLAVGAARDRVGKYLRAHHVLRRCQGRGAIAVQSALGTARRQSRQCASAKDPCASTMRSPPRPVWRSSVSMFCV